jgi:hypothetical protein
MKYKNSIVTQEDEGQIMKETIVEDEKGKNNSSFVENHVQEVVVEEGKGVDERYAMNKTVRKRIPKNNKEINEVEKTLVFYGNNQRRKHANVSFVVKSNLERNGWQTKIQGKQKNH